MSAFPGGGQAYGVLVRMSISPVRGGGEGVFFVCADIVYLLISVTQDVVFVTPVVPWTSTVVEASLPDRFAAVGRTLDRIAPKSGGDGRRLSP